MARLTADLTEVKDAERVPKATYTSHIESAQPMKGKNAPFNPYIQLSHMIEGDETGGPSTFAGRKVNYDNLSIGGTDKNGNPIVPFRLAKVLECFEIPHTCLSCHPEVEAEVNSDSYDGRYDTTATFIKSDGTGGYPKGQMLCGNCQKPMNVSYDTMSFVGKRGRIVVDIENDLKGRPQNTVKDYLPIR